MVLFRISFGKITANSTGGPRHPQLTTCASRHANLPIAPPAYAMSAAAAAAPLNTVAFVPVALLSDSLSNVSGKNCGLVCYV